MEEPSAAILRSLGNLRSESCAVSKFICAWDGLHSLFNSINSSMDSLSFQLDSTAGSSPQWFADEIPQSEATESEEADSCDIHNTSFSDKEDSDDGEPKPGGKINLQSERRRQATLRMIESIFDQPNASKHLLKFVQAQLSSGLQHMYEEIPVALARVQDPAPVVIGCLDQFHKLGRPYRTPKKAGIPGEQHRAAMLIVELFLLSGRAVPWDELAPNVRKEADIIIWACKTRMDARGGVRRAAIYDKRDLLILLASFGIPPQFGDQDLVSLILKCTQKRKKSRVFRESPILVTKVTEIVQDMVKHARHLSAAELVVAMRLEEKFPLQPILSSYLDTIKRKGANVLNQGRISAISMKEAFGKQLSTLQSIAKFLYKNKLSTTYASLEVNTTISKLEEYLLSFDEKIQSLNDQGTHSKPHQIPNAALETGLKPQILNRRRPGDSAPFERTETGAELQNLNAKRKAEETTPLERIEYRSGSSSSQPNAAFQNSVSLNMCGSVSSRRPSLEHPYSMPGPANMQTSSFSVSTVSGRVVYPGLDRRFPSSLHDFPVLPTGKGLSEYSENGEGSYVPPFRHHGSELYDRFRDSAGSTIRSAGDAFGLSQLGIAGTTNYLGARPDVQHVSTWQTATQEPHPHGAGSRAPHSTNPYNFADMV